jgi:hypothetical protein
MLECLIAADCSDDTVVSALTSRLKSFEKSSGLDITAGLSFIEALFEVIALRKILTPELLSSALHSACTFLPAELCIAVISHLFSKYNVITVAALRVCNVLGELPIHTAAEFSRFNVFHFFLEKHPESLFEFRYPESLVAVTFDGRNLLHMALTSCQNIAIKVKYLCNICPELLNMRNADGMTPFLSFLSGPVNLEIIKIMCEADETVVRERCISTGYYNDYFPLEMLVDNATDENRTNDILIFGKCYRYLLNLYPAGLNAAENDLNYVVDHLHFIAEQRHESQNTIRLLLNFESPKRRDLNYAARKEGMFLAFRALTSDANPSIWVKLRHENRDLLIHTMSYL